MDERFATPRASALSSRSNCSSLYTARSQGSTSSNERWYTPSVSSARSASSFASARSQLQLRSPMDTVQIHRHNNDAYSFTDRDRARDFRRFDQPHSYRRSATAVDSSYDFHLAESGGAEAKGRYARLNNPMPSRAERNQDMFSLARHGRAVSYRCLEHLIDHQNCIWICSFWSFPLQGELEELLLQGVSIESK